MKAVIEREQQVAPPIKSVTLTLTLREACVLREVGNWSSKIAGLLSENSFTERTITQDDYREVLAGLWATLDKAGISKDLTAYPCIR